MRPSVSLEYYRGLRIPTMKSHRMAAWGGIFHGHTNDQAGDVDPIGARVAGGECVGSAPVTKPEGRRISSQPH